MQQEHGAALYSSRSLKQSENPMSWGQAGNSSNVQVSVDPFSSGDSMRPTMREDVCFLLDSAKMWTTKKRRWEGGGGTEDEGGMKAEKGEQLSLVGATRPADVSRQWYRDEGAEDVLLVPDKQAAQNLLTFFKTLTLELKSLLFFRSLTG